MTDANRRAFARIAAARPQWVGVAAARSVLGLEGKVLLHAGPPLRDPKRLPPPMRNAAVLSCLYEGWAQDEREAEALIDAGEVRLEPSFTRHAATPLVALISPRTTLARIADGDRRYYAFLGSGGGPQQRFGARDRAILERLEFRERELAPGFAELLDEPVDLLAIARAAIREGDDLHNRLSSATTILHAVLLTRKAESAAARAALRTVADAPLYFLNLWMPACQLMLSAADGEAGASLVSRLCANGQETGVQVAGLPGEWFTAPATPVQGPFMKGAPTDAQMPPATGDSGVIDAFGLGGQALRHAPSLRAAFAQWLAEDDDVRARAMLAGPHPILETPVAIDAALVVQSGRTPLLSTGMVSADGRGLLGRGLCAVPLQPFAAAVARLRR